MVLEVDTYETKQRLDIEVDPGPLKSLLCGEKYVPETLFRFILEKWFLSDVNIKIAGDLDLGSYTVEATGESWTRRFVVENHMVTEDEGLKDTRGTGNEHLDSLLAKAGPDVKKIYFGFGGKVNRVRVSKGEDFVNLQDITEAGYKVGVFMVGTDEYFWSLIWGGTRT